MRQFNWFFVFLALLLPPSLCRGQNPWSDPPVSDVQLAELPPVVPALDEPQFTAELAAPPATVEERLVAIEKELKKQADAAAKKKVADAKKPTFQLLG